MKKIKIKVDEHVGIFGMTGSGKTTFMKKLYTSFQQHDIVILDIKHEIEQLPKTKIVYNFSDIDSCLKSKTNVIFCPPVNEQIYNQVADYVYRRGNTILILDESAIVIPEGRLSDEYKTLFVMGRSRKAICWFLAQRPAIVSKTAMSQATHIFCFALVQSHDKKAICANIPLEIEKFDNLPVYWLFHYKQGDKEVIQFEADSMTNNPMNAALHPHKALSK